MSKRTVSELPVMNERDRVRLLEGMLTIVGAATAVIHYFGGVDALKTRLATMVPERLDRLEEEVARVTRMKRLLDDLTNGLMPTKEELN